MQWEYRVFVLPTETAFFTGARFDEAELEQEANRLGRQGWELVTAFDTNRAQGGTRDIVLLFKRPRVATALPADG